MDLLDRLVRAESPDLLVLTDWWGPLDLLVLPDRRDPLDLLVLPDRRG